MNKEEDKWERMTNLTEIYEPNPNLANSAIEKINRQELKAKSKKPFKIWASVAACFLVCCIGLAIFLPVYLTGRSLDEVYYSEEALEIVEVNDTERFVTENNLQVHYFSYDGTVTQSAKIAENNQWAYLIQKLFDVGENGYFYRINLHVVILTSASFDFYMDYESLSLNTFVSNISVDYSLIENDDGYNYKIRFSYENNTYYLSITTLDEGVGVIEKYINELIK